MSIESFNNNNGDLAEITLSIIIVNYNGRIFLQKCLQAVVRNVSCVHEVIVVDNNSQDGSREYLSLEWPDVRLICSDDNLGFARGKQPWRRVCSWQISVAAQQYTEMLQPVQPLVEYLDAHPDTAVIGGRLRNPDGSIRQASVGYDHNPSPPGVFLDAATHLYAFQSMADFRKTS